MTVSSPFSSGSIRLLALTLLVSSMLGCAFGEIRMTDPFDRQLTFDEAQRKYTIYVRFSEFQKARAFLVEEYREDFLQAMNSLDEARFTDFESESVELGDDKQTATVRVTYTIYTPSMPFEVEVTEVQVWNRNGITNNWQVISNFEGLDRFAAN